MPREGPRPPRGGADDLVPGIGPKGAAVKTGSDQLDPPANRKPHQIIHLDSASNLDAERAFCFAGCRG